MADKEKKDAAISVDDQFLKDFIARGGNASTDTGRLVDESNVDTLLDEVANKSGTPKQSALHKKAIAQGTADTTKEDAEEAAKEQARNDRLREMELRKQRNKALNVATKASNAVQSNVTDPLLAKAGNAVDRISTLKTVGGVGLLLVILIFLLFVVVQVNSAGDTRIKQFWYMLNGRASLIGRQIIGANGQPSSSGVPGAVNPNGTVNGANGQPITLQSLQSQSNQAVSNPQGPLSQWIESEYRTLFG